MKTLSDLEIGQHFKFFRKNARRVYLGYLDGEYHFAYVFATNDKDGTTTFENARVTPLKDLK